MAGILAHAGVEGFLAEEDLEDLYRNADLENNEWEEFLIRWETLFGGQWVKVRELVEAMPSNRGGLREVLPVELLEAYDRQGLGFDRKLGVALGKKVGVRYGTRGLHLERTQDSHTKQSLWRVV